MKKRNRSNSHQHSNQITQRDHEHEEDILVHHDTNTPNRNTPTSDVPHDTFSPTNPVTYSQKDAADFLVTLVSANADVDAAAINAVLTTMKTPDRMRLVSAIPRNLPSASKTAIIVALKNGTIPPECNDTNWIAKAIVQGLGPITALHQARQIAIYPPPLAPPQVYYIRHLPSPENSRIEPHGNR